MIHSSPDDHQAGQAFRPHEILCEFPEEFVPDGFSGRRRSSRCQLELWALAKRKMRLRRTWKRHASLVNNDALSDPPRSYSGRLCRVEAIVTVTVTVTVTATVTATGGHDDDDDEEAGTDTDSQTAHPRLAVIPTSAILCVSEHHIAFILSKPFGESFVWI